MTDPTDRILPGTAGGSARREFERRREARAQRIRSRLGRRVGNVVLALTDEPRTTRAWARGSEGEEEFANALADVPGIRLLHDRRVPGTRGNIDHIVVAPAGLFVVDAKAHTGTIRVRDVGGLFKRDERLFVGRRDCSKLADAMTWQTEAVEHALRSAGSSLNATPMLCFIHGKWPLFKPPNSYRGVRLESPRSIKKLVTASAVLSALDVDAIAAVLSAALPPKTVNTLRRP